MEIKIPVSQDVWLTITDKPDERMVYPTSRLQKGLLMSCRGLDLAEEAVGIGVPVLKRGLQTVFPGEVELHFLRRDRTWEVTAAYTINLVERIARPGRASVNNEFLYDAKNFFAAFIRWFPHLRESMTAVSGALRRLFGWETTYEKAGFSTQVKMTYSIDEHTGVLSIEADLSRLPQGNVTEVILMNEQGGHYFDQYSDSSGTHLSGKQVGCWDAVTAEDAAFSSSTQRVAFTAHKVPGARLFRGRELIGSRLAWSGFGYSFPPSAMTFSYTMSIKELT